jgi:hypothetical protein
MMGLDKIFFLEGPFWRLRGTDDLFFFFWSSRPIVTVVYYGELRLVVGARFGVEGRMGRHCTTLHRGAASQNLVALAYLIADPCPRRLRPRSRMCPQP